MTRTINEIVLLDADTLGLDDLDLSDLEAMGTSLSVYGKTDGRDILARCANADIVITNKVILDAPILNNLQSVKLVCIAATGTNNIDLKSATKNDILVCNVPQYSTQSVAQHTFMLLLSLQNKLLETMQAVKHWPNSETFCILPSPYHDISGKTLGIVGYGAVGKAVETIAKSFGMKVLIAERPNTAKTRPGRTPFDDTLSSSDFITLHCPLTAETKHLVNADSLGLMKASAVLINTARGPVIDEEALAAALINNKLAGAGLDVLSSEPPEKTNALLKVKGKNLIITPHIAWASVEARQRLIKTVASNIRAFSEGKTQNIVSS